jgi:CRP/FNR family transcriptional regulator
LLIKLALPGDIIGGPGLLVDSIHHYTAMAVVDTSTCFVDAGVFEENLRANSDFALAMIQRINKSAIHNFDAMLTHTQKLMPGRVAGTLLYLYKSIYKTNPFYLTITRQDLADLASMTKESMIRVLKEFKDSDIIETDGNMVRVLDEKKLNEVASKG